MALHAVTAGDDPRLRNLANRRICASVFLQQLLYYNLIFDVGWILFWFVWLCKIHWVGLRIKDDDIGRTIVIIFWLIFEPLRMTAGFYGNLKENVPWLLMFTVISLIPEHATCYYLMLGSFDIRPVNKAVQIVQALFLSFSILGGIYAMRKMYVAQKEQFYLYEFWRNSRVRQRAAAETAARLAAARTAQ